MASLQHCVHTTTTHWTACAAGATASPAQVVGLPPRPLPMSRPGLHAASPLSHSRFSNYRGGLPVGRPLSTVTVKAVVPRVEQMGSGAYDAKTNNRYWERRPVPVASRLIVIGAELTRWYARSTLLKLKLNPQQYGKAATTPNGAPTPASLMREMLCRLGPAFVKIGQALSSRPDLLPPAYLMEFEQLQDRIPPFPNDQAFQVLENELGVSANALFSSFSPEPVAAASLGQVYRAKLRGRPGQPDMEVAVKVQRPGVAQSISLDVYILRWAAAVLRQVRKLNTNLPALVDEWASSLFRELDYRTELDNAERFKSLYSHMKEIYVPNMYKEFTTSQVLTMEWIDGVRLRSASSAERMEAVMRRARGAGRSSNSSSSGLKGSEEDLALVEAGVRCSLEQMLEDGFYHADPHPGNLLKMRDGRLAYLDFGMCGSLDKKTRQALVTSTLHLVNREYTRLADDFVNLGLLPTGADKSKVVPALTEVFQSALSAGVTNVSFSQLSGNLGRTMYQFNFRIPPYYTLLVRSLTVLEGIALASNPDYKVLGSAYPWIARRLLTDRSPELREALRALLYGQDGRFRFSRLESLLQEAVLTPPSSKPKPGGISSGATNGGTNGNGNGAANGGVLALLLGDEGEFVRDILLDELAKGIDGGWRLAFDASVDAAARAPALLFSPAWLFPAPSPNPVQISTTSSASSSGSSSSSSGSSSSSNQGTGGRPLPSGAGSGNGSSSSSALVTTSSSGSAQQGGAQGSTSSSSSGGSSSSGTQASASPPTSSVPTQEQAGAMTYQGGLMMSALPRLSSREDYEQVQGILQLSRAMAALVAIRRSGATSAQDRLSSSVRGSSSDASARGGRDIGGPGAQQDAAEGGGFVLPQPLAAVEQGSTALTWLAAEIRSVPPEMRAQALRLPGELASRVTSRILARTLRSLAGANGSSGSSASTGVSA